MSLEPSKAGWFGRFLEMAFSFRKLGGGGGVPYFGVLIIRILLFRVLYWGPLFSETL